jgi:hypothetical protein
MEQSEDTGATRCRWSQDVKKYSFLNIHNSAKNDFCQDGEKSDGAKKETRGDARGRIA